MTQEFLEGAMKNNSQEQINHLVETSELLLLSTIRETGTEDLMYIFKDSVDPTGLSPHCEELRWLLSGQVLVTNRGNGVGERIRKRSIHRVGTPLGQGVSESEMLRVEVFRVKKDLDESTAFYLESCLIQLGIKIVPYCDEQTSLWILDRQHGKQPRSRHRCCAWRDFTSSIRPPCNQCESGLVCPDHVRCEPSAFDGIISSLLRQS